MTKLKKGDKINLSNPPKVKLGDYKIVWVDTEPKYKPKYSVTNDYSEYIKENKK